MSLQWGAALGGYAESVAAEYLTIAINEHAGLYFDTSTTGWQFTKDAIRWAAYIQ